MKAFDSSSTGIPFGQVNLATGGSSNIPWAGNNAILAEFGTLQLEYRWLDAFINTPETADMRKKVENIYDILYKMSPPIGLYPYYMKNQNSGSGLPTFANDHYTFGAMADSFYEYMLKIWLQGGKVEPMYRYVQRTRNANESCCIISCRLERVPRMAINDYFNGVGSGFPNSLLFFFCLHLQGDV